MSNVIEKDVRNNDKVKQSFLSLAKQTFCLNFKDWENKGFWSEKFRPYCLIQEGKVISNVSVNDMTFVIGGEIKHYVQLGTVMTDPEYRNQGLGRIIMEEVIKEYKDKVDGIYLFANDSVLDYYPKFGFKVGTEYEYYREVHQPNAIQTVQKVDMTNLKTVDEVVSFIQTRTLQEAFGMVENRGLDGFYATQVFSNQYFYIEKENAYVISEQEGNTLVIYQVIADHVVDLNKIIEAFGQEIQEVVLAFTPIQKEQFHKRIHTEEGSTLFYIGDALETVLREEIMFPVVSHA